ncbi:hypothetical protein GGR56DRAFT_658336 [Xylariaceae sp. FL0804]|nr:hypothetical protein GGR56DRAFT_658336 [Xylariaceae sp. FL0804]
MTFRAVLLPRLPSAAGSLDRGPGLPALAKAASPAATTAAATDHPTTAITVAAAAAAATAKRQSQLGKPQQKAPLSSENWRQCPQAAMAGSGGDGRIRRRRWRDQATAGSSFLGPDCRAEGHPSPPLDAIRDGGPGRGWTRALEAGSILLCSQKSEVKRGQLRKGARRARGTTHGGL